MISIHALREEGDRWTAQSFPTMHISIHALREEGDYHPRTVDRSPSDFYPRPPRGGRPFYSSAGSTIISISIHALREEGDGWTSFLHGLPVPISIHALREEGDITTAAALWAWWEFLSTPSARRATINAAMDSGVFIISIHALREEGDEYRRNILCDYYRISIHALREEGDGFPLQDYNTIPDISIHALREEGDPTPSSGISTAPIYFYPRPPRGGRPSLPISTIIPLRFLSTPSARRATFHKVGAVVPTVISIHALREEGDLPSSQSDAYHATFLSTPSARRATRIFQCPAT